MDRKIVFCGYKLSHAVHSCIANFYAGGLVPISSSCTSKRKFQRAWICTGLHQSRSCFYVGTKRRLDIMQCLKTYCVFCNQTEEGSSHQLVAYLLQGSRVHLLQSSAVIAGAPSFSLPVAPWFSTALRTRYCMHSRTVPQIKHL